MVTASQSVSETMDMNKMLAKLITFFMVMLLAGCGGGDDAFKTPGTATGGATAGTATDVQMALTVGVATLSAGGSTSVTAVLTNVASGTPYTTNTDVTFTSTCTTAQIASLISPITTSGGSAVSTYVAKGCEGVDTITATATVDSGTVIAAATVTVLPAVLGSIQFVSATPQSITLKGTGGAGLSETSTVIFKVFNSVGGIVPNRDVTFSLTTSVGGLTLSPATAKTDANGQAQTVVQSGTVSTPVRVTATIVGTSITTQSDQLTITTGVPDQDSFSLSATKLNIEGWDIDGVTSTLTTRLSDHFSNPVPNGTIVNFRSEGGQMGGSCSITSGACSALLTSANLRPTNGRVTVLAYSIGEESFTDYNGNGLMNAGEAFDVNGLATDRGEAFVDYSEDGLRQSNEDFIDFNVNGTFESAGDGLYNGVLCDGTGICSAQTTINVRRSMVIVFSGSAANIVFSASPINLAVCANGTPFANTPVNFTVTIFDVNGNSMAPGTTVEFTATNGKIESLPPNPLADSVACLTGFPGCPVGAPALGSYGVTMTSDATQDTATLACTNAKTTGSFNVKVTTPRGLISTASVTVND